MPETDRIGDLLRSEVSTLFDVLECNISIKVNGTRKTADYTYEYTVSKKADGPDRWRIVFAYPPSEVTLTLATDQDGTMLKVPPKQPLPSSPSITEVWIEFGKHIELGETYTFRYSVSTKIEGLPPSSPLGGYGTVWFWVTHEYYCKLVRIQFLLPKSLRIRANDPIATPIDDLNGRVFVNRDLLPQQFCMALITYEKRLLGIDSRLLKGLVNFLWLCLGAFA